MTNYQQQVQNVFQALADPTRRAIVQRLARGPQPVAALAQPFEMALPTVLQHIRVLEASGLVGTQKTGRVRLCELRPDAFRRAEDWLATQRSLWEARLDQLDAYLLDLHGKETDDVR